MFSSWHGFATITSTANSVPLFNITHFIRVSIILYVAYFTLWLGLHYHVFGSVWIDACNLCQRRVWLKLIRRPLPLHVIITTNAKFWFFKFFLHSAYSSRQLKLSGSTDSENITVKTNYGKQTMDATPWYRKAWVEIFFVPFCSTESLLKMSIFIKGYCVLLQNSWCVCARICACVRVHVGACVRVNLLVTEH